MAWRASNFNSLNLKQYVLKWAFSGFALFDYFYFISKMRLAESMFSEFTKPYVP
jgi:hypothetical protein